MILTASCWPCSIFGAVSDSYLHTHKQKHCANEKEEEEEREIQSCYKLWLLQAIKNVLRSHIFHPQCQQPKAKRNYNELAEDDCLCTRFGLRGIKWTSSSVNCWNRRHHKKIVYVLRQWPLAFHLFSTFPPKFLQRQQQKQIKCTKKNRWESFPFCLWKNFIHSLLFSVRGAKDF